MRKSKGSDVLHVFLKGKWYDMIEADKKKEEYRKITPYWVARMFKESLHFPKGVELHDFFIKCGKYHGIYRPKVKSVVFHRGYTDATMRYNITSIVIGKGNSEWDAPKDKEVFIIKLGKRIK